MNDNLMNPRTVTLFMSFLKRPSSSVIIEGSEASGAHELCNQLIVDLLGRDHVNNIIQVELEDKKSIGVEKIRELKKSLITSAGSGNGVARVALVKNADTITPEAQNSLLKMIEEPAASTLIVLLCDQTNNLLETVRSRCQIIKVLPITKSQAFNYGQENGRTEADIQKAFLLSAGSSKLFLSILNNKAANLTDAINTAKAFIAAKPFERLLRQKDFADSLSLDQLLKSLILLAEAGLHGPNKAARHKWEQILRTIKECEMLLNKNTAPKLVFLRLSSGI